MKEVADIGLYPQRPPPPGAIVYVYGVPYMPVPFVPSHGPGVGVWRTGLPGQEGEVMPDCSSLKED